MFLLLSEGEQRFYRSGLLPAIAGRYAVSLKVRLADVIGCKESSRSTGFRKIQSKHLDFVLITPRTSMIIAVIELNDATHDQLRRKQRDQFVADALRAAGIPLIAIPIYETYRPEVIRHHLWRVLKRRSA